MAFPLGLRSVEPVIAVQCSVLMGTFRTCFWHFSSSSSQKSSRSEICICLVALSNLASSEGTKSPSLCYGCCTDLDSTGVSVQLGIHFLFFMIFPPTWPAPGVIWRCLLYYIGCLFDWRITPALFHCFVGSGEILRSMCKKYVHARVLDDEMDSSKVYLFLYVSPVGFGGAPQ